jgi:hypothetical protein
LVECGGDVRVPGFEKWKTIAPAVLVTESRISSESLFFSVSKACGSVPPEIS